MATPPSAAARSRALVDELTALGVELVVDGERLRIRAPPGVLDDDHRARLRALKPELLELLASSTNVVPAPLTGPQRQLWFVLQTDPDAAGLELILRMRLRGRLDRAALDGALCDLVARHEALRTRIEQRDGVPAALPQPAPIVAPWSRERCDPQAGRPFVASLDPRGDDGWELSLRVHHIACDGWSMSVLLGDLAALYSARIEGRNARLPALALTPCAVARELAQRERTPDFAARLAGWAGRMAGVEPVALPVDRRPPARSSGIGGRVRRAVAPGVWPAALAAARDRGATGFMLVAAALALVLGRWTRAREICLGIPYANRGRPELEPLVGMFVDTLLVRVALADGGEPFAALLERVRDATLATIEHADLPLDRVVARLHRERSMRGLGPQPAVPDVMLNFVGFEPPAPALAGLDCELDAQLPGARFDLTVYAYPRPDTLELAAAFRSDAFDEGTVAALLEQLEFALARAPGSSRPWPTIPLAAARTLAVVGHGSRLAITAAIDAVAGQRTAVASRDATLDYAELRGRARALATALGPAPARVVVLARREPELAVALLAALIAGCSFVMIDAGYPVARQLELLAVARPSAWICIGAAAPPAALLDALAEVSHVAIPDAPRPVPVPVPVPAPVPVPVPARPGPAASAERYLAFTSGTTGRPRAVVGTLAPLEHFFAWYVAALAITPDDRFASLAGLGHDPCLRDLLGALVAGARVCMPPDEPAQMGPALGRWLAGAEITIIHVTPALARRIAATTDALPALRHVCFGGDHLRGSDVARWRELAPGATLWNFYGTTETPQAIAVHRCTEADAARPQVPIGSGIADVALELATPAGPAAIGEIGEIHVRTPHLAAGYLDEPELTRARFELGVRYATGDLGRRRHDGSVICLGRIDDQVVIRGVRIEPAEVEATIAACSGTAAGVAARELGSGQRELAAWVVGVEPAALASLRRDVARRLPAAMVPTRWATIDALPLTANAKLDRRALARLELDADGRDAGGFEAPVGPLESALATIWARLLDRARVGRRDDFFAIGGHSLLAVELAVQIDATLGLELPIRELFEQSTLAGCAQLLAGRRAARLPELVAREPSFDDDGERVYPASFAQQRIWLLQALDEDAPQPSITHTLRPLAGRPPWSPAALDRALVELERRHPVLRTRFVLDGDRLLARVGRPRATILERGQPPAAGPRFDLARGPIWRAWAWTHASGEARLELDLHHIAGEAGSMRILVADLAELYRAALDDRPPQLAEPTIDYADVAAWQRALVEGDRARSELASWRERLAGLAPLELPLARPRPPRQGYRGAWTHAELGPAIERGLIERAARASTTIYAVVLTALAAVLARWCGTADVAIGSPVGLRPHPATAELVGPFLELVCVRIDAGGDPSLSQLLDRATARAREAFARSSVPFEQVVRVVHADTDGTRELGRTPLFSVLLNVVDVGTTERGWAQLGAQRVIEREPVARYDLAVYAIRHADGLRLAISRDADLFDGETIELLLEHLRATIDCLIAAPERTLSTLELRNPAPLAGGPAIAGPERSVVERFAAIARAHPEAIAVDTPTARTSYAALAGQASAAAGALRDARVARAGLLVREDADMAAGMLGALAAGVAYVPLDPRLPIAHLRELVDDAELDALMSTTTLEPLAAALASGRPIVRLDALAPLDPTALAPVADDGLAYLLYTSGSTGQPKAVMQSRRNLLHHARTYAARLELEVGDRLSLVSTHAFDAAVMDIYGSLLAGATLCPIDLRGEALASLPAQLRARALTVLHATPTVLRHLVAALEHERGPAVAGLRWIVLGGEEARWDDARAAARWFGPRARLINGLGPTESTLALQAIVELDAIPADATGSLTIGAPVPGVAVRLATAIGEQVAPHGIGEIVIESEHVALGYWRRPRATAAAFADGPRRYQTGDLGRRLADGRLAFAGRRGGFLKLRGHRIEPGEIEARLRELPGVRAAAVDLRDAELVGFYAGKTSPAAIRGALAAVLPRARVPTQLVQLDALPETPTGKVDRRALARLDVPRSTAATSAEAAPASPAEAAVAAIWAAALGRTPAGVELDFFACGGDSLGAARVVAALARELGVEVRLAELFEGCTIAEIARRTADGAGGSDREQEHRRGPARARLTRLADGPGLAWIVVLPPGQRPTSLEPLAAALGRPLAALEPPSFGDSGPLPSLDAIIEAMLTELATHTHYALAGVSNGGLLAWALAARARATGRPPRALVLLDTLPPELLAARPWRDRDPCEQLSSFVRHLCGVEIPVSALAVLPPARRLAHAFTLAREHGSRQTEPSLDEFAATFERFSAHGERVHRLLATLELKPGEPPPGEPPPGEPPPILVEARAGEPRELGPRWRRLVGELRVIDVPGTHLGMLAPPHVEQLAAALAVLPDGDDDDRR